MAKIVKKWIGGFYSTWNPLNNTRQERCVVKQYRFRKTAVLYTPIEPEDGEQRSSQRDVLQFKTNFRKNELFDTEQEAIEDILNKIRRTVEAKQKDLDKWLHIQSEAITSLISGYNPGE